MYYLKSRYYDPETCRFVNADKFVGTGQGIIGYNMFAYCNNNPVNFSDTSGSKMTCCVVVNDGGGRGNVFEEQDDSETQESGNEQVIFSIEIDSKWKLYLFEVATGAVTAGEYVATVGVIIAAVETAPATLGGSLATAGIAFDVLASSGVSTASNFALMTDTSIKFKQNGSARIEFYFPASPDDFWEWLINSGWRVK